MKQAQETFTVATTGQGLYEITGRIAEWAAARGIATGLLTLYCRHTSASLVIQENADPAVAADLERYFKTAAPEDPPLNDHTAEGADDMPAHIRSALTQTSLSIPLRDGRLALGTWQGIFLFEHRFRPRSRELIAHLSGE
jgi:secondary thiamine-phosphate synthase enzyme